MPDGKVHIDPMSRVFAKVVWKCTLFGIAVMIIFGLFYILGLNPHLDPLSSVKHWDKSVDHFWETVRGSRVKDYSWFLHSLKNMDSLSMLGIIILCMTPFLAVCFSIFQAKGVYRILMLVLIIELIFSIIRPFI